MHDLSKSVLEIVSEVAEQFKNDVPAAVDEAERRVTQLPDYGEQVRSLLRKALQEAIYDARHATNVAIKREAGYYAQRPTAGDFSVVEKVYKRVYDYCIGGVTLGEIRGKDLLVVMGSEEAKAHGHLFNVSLCRWLLSKGVTGESRVKDVVGEAELESNFHRLRKQAARGAA